MDRDRDRGTGSEGREARRYVTNPFALSFEIVYVKYLLTNLFVKQNVYQKIRILHIHLNSNEKVYVYHICFHSPFYVREIILCTQ